MTHQTAKQDEPACGCEKKPQEKKHLDDELTRALQDTFPGSDPVAVSQPPHSHHDKGSV